MNKNYPASPNRAGASTVYSGSGGSDAVGKGASPTPAKPNGKAPKRVIRTPEERVEFQKANLGQSAAICARRLLRVAQQANTLKLDVAKVCDPLSAALGVACGLGVFAGKLEKTGKAICKYLNRQTEKSGRVYSIDAAGRLRSGKVVIQFDE